MTIKKKKILILLLAGGLSRRFGGGIKTFAKINGVTIFEKIIGGLKKQGVTSIFITHNLNHIFPIADHLCVMARGEKIADMEKKNTNIDELTELLVNG